MDTVSEIMHILNKDYPADYGSIRDIHTDLKACLGSLGYRDNAQDPFILGSSELFTNALKYAEKAPSRFHVSLIIEGTELVFTLKDNGSGFEDFNLMRETSDLQGAEMKNGLLETGGIGLFLTGRDFDRFAYKRIDDWNHYHLSAPSPFQDSNPRLLIIDDDPAQRDLLSIFVSGDYDVQHACSGKAAMEFLKNADEPLPDLILCDVVMRDGDGAEFCRRLQSDKELALIPFIFMTGKPENSIAKTAEDLPVNNFLQKPVTKDILLKTLKRTHIKAKKDKRIIGDRLDAEVTAILAPQLPTSIGEHNVALRWQATEAGGGDIVLHLKGRKCDHIIVMDVMGHGDAAKFFSHSFAGYLYGFLYAQSHIQDPAEILTGLSNFLHHDKIGEKTILTAQIVTFYTDGSLKIASAGHPAPLLYDGSGVTPLDIEGTIPGLIGDIQYESLDLSLSAKQRLILYTDGLMEVGDTSEAMKAHCASMLNTIEDTHSIPLEQSTDLVWDYFLEETHAMPSDDTVLIMLQRD